MPCRTRAGVRASCSSPTSRGSGPSSDDLMEISRFDAGAEHIALEPVDIGRLVTAVVAARIPAASVAIAGDLPVIDTDPRRLERILGNLLDNAREHAAGTPVDVDVAVSADALVISVADRGPGVPPERMPHIFERFYKADPSRHAGSSGLGLAIAAEHAELLGGTLDAEARDGGGLRMELRLPVTGSLPAGDEAAMSEAEGMTDTDRPQEPIR